MVDYFDANGTNGGPAGVDGAAATNGVAASGGDDLGMDEISVSKVWDRKGYE